MAYEQRDNNGSLFKNDKEGNQARPDYKGKAMVNGRLMYLSAWVKTTQGGQKYMSIAFDAPKDEQPAQPEATQAPDAVEDDLPF